MNKVLLSSAYLPPVEYFVRAYHALHVDIEQWDNYQKQTFRNRCSIVSANGVMPLSIPVIKPSANKVLTKDIRIDYQKSWQHMHWNAIVSAYGSSPFFEFYRDELAPFYHKQEKFLFDFNLSLLHLVLEWLQIDSQKFGLTKEYQFTSESFLDCRENIHPKKTDNNTLEILNSIPYYQVFGNKWGFIPNQSIIDLIFNLGNESILVLHKLNI